MGEHCLQKCDCLSGMVLRGQAVDRYVHRSAGRVGDVGDEFPVLSLDFVDIAAAVHVDGAAGCWIASGGDGIDREIIDG